ncbi:hypothetical protein WOLCODRAFT_19367 [Wolfiporia cocos MD-104 SS10]|uniref:Uncharacterized protein n=1 Tax=Wolfiporia cocos (strain MD-104) TaxID=742152 RepID=A0A2H3K7P9_WOLCO|nr:hypothetical protein WOLCODRAFT_19367 [Wolfiporia cocos MD-104 SS10]
MSRTTARAAPYSPDNRRHARYSEEYLEETRSMWDDIRGSIHSEFHSLLSHCLSDDEDGTDIGKQQGHKSRSLGPVKYTRTLRRHKSIKPGLRGLHGNPQSTAIQQSSDARTLMGTARKMACGEIEALERLLVEMRLTFAKASESCRLSVTLLDTANGQHDEFWDHCDSVAYDGDENMEEDEFLEHFAAGCAPCMTLRLSDSWDNVELPLITTRVMRDLILFYDQRQLPTLRQIGVIDGYGSLEWAPSDNEYRYVASGLIGEEGVDEKPQYHEDVLYKGPGVHRTRYWLIRYATRAAANAGVVSQAKARAKRAYTVQRVPSHTNNQDVRPSMFGTPTGYHALATLESERLRYLCFGSKDTPSECSDDDDSAVPTRPASLEPTEVDGEKERSVVSLTSTQLDREPALNWYHTRSARRSWDNGREWAELSTLNAQAFRPLRQDGYRLRDYRKEMTCYGIPFYSASLRDPADLERFHMIDRWVTQVQTAGVSAQNSRGRAQLPAQVAVQSFGNPMNVDGMTHTEVASDAGDIGGRDLEHVERTVQGTKKEMGDAKRKARGTSRKGKGKVATRKRKRKPRGIH